MDPNKWDKLKLKGILEETDTKNVTDWVKRYKSGTDSKYGSLMYSPTLKRLRHVTFSEFYGDGIVD